eukprot:TRINITY_DN4935_c0_g2_i10.p2 TRINITY_DN4935_c0_g2~~TRINITY_DN4935_c0_g2_i10.p2  ORF type:complete len:422 (-),score=46.34 TRINITY_DN4935_c0_g2_i10:297-1562(-)
MLAVDESDKPRHEPIVWNNSERGSEEGEEEGRISGELETARPPERKVVEEGEQEEENSWRNNEEAGKHEDAGMLDNKRNSPGSPRYDGSPRHGYDDSYDRRDTRRPARVGVSDHPVRQPHDRRVNGNTRYFPPRGGFRGGRGNPYYARRFRSRSPMRNRSRSRSPTFRRQFPPSSFPPFSGSRGRSPPPPPPPPPYSRGGFRGRGSMYSRDYMISRRPGDYDRGMPYDRYGPVDPPDRFPRRGYRERGGFSYRGGRDSRYEPYAPDDRHRRPPPDPRGYSPPPREPPPRGRLDEFYEGRRRQAELERQARPSSRQQNELEEQRRIVKRSDDAKEGYADSQDGDSKSENWNFSENSKEWYYMDPQGATQGPCSISQFKQWLEYMKNDGELQTEYEKFKSVTVWKDGLEKRIPLMLLLRNNKP